MHTYDLNIEAKILDLLRWSSEQYNELVLETGIRYLKNMAPEYPQVTRQIASTSIFWNWWRHHWQRRDEQFIEECETWITTLDKYRTVYENHNDARTLAAALYLNGQVLESSYAPLMEEIMQSQKQPA